MKRYLVCLDGSSRARGVLNAAVDLALETGAKLHLFRSVGLSPEVPVEAYSTSPNRLAGVLVERSKRELEDLSKELPEQIVDGVSSRIGSPWQSICDVARELHVQMIIVGSHGFDALDRLLGTTAARVVNHADRPVLVVRPVPTHAMVTEPAPSTRSLKAASSEGRASGARPISQGRIR